MKIRQKMFETNSSSTHSVSIAESYDHDILDTLRVDHQGCVTVEPGEFGWGFDKFTDAPTKASYCLTYIQSPKCPKKKRKENMLRRVIMKQTGCEEVFFGEEGGYIDHQSAPGEDGIGTEGRCEEIFSSRDKLRDFIFNPKSKLFIDNDNRDNYYQDRDNNYKNH